MSVGDGTPRSVDETTRLRRSPDVAARVIEDHVVLLHARSGVSVALNRTAGIVWDMLDGSPVGDVLDDIVSVSGAARPDVAAQVLGVLHELSQGGFLDEPAPR
jgi:hypothetical protein